jgi:hydrogenase/urease accessory protein HupE
VARWAWLVFALLVSLVCAPLHAHEARPAYLQLQQTAADSYDVLWKLPGQSEGRRLALEVRFAPDVSVRTRLPAMISPNAVVQHWQVQREGGLDGTAIQILGLEFTLTDVLVRLERLDGSTRTLRVVPASPSFVVEPQAGGGEVARTYLALGIEHILLGVDHLLFVLALVLLVKGARRLLATITAFTLAHSLTLAAATLGWVHVPAPPVEASIALSIVFVAREILQANAGRTGLTSRQPWLVAFCFGLLHGLGFAGALSEVGLPGHAIPIALLFFNLGVEFGQLAFVAVVSAALFAARRAPWPRRAWLNPVPAYAIGTLAACWTIERVIGFWV